MKTLIVIAALLLSACAPQEPAARSTPTETGAPADQVNPAEYIQKMHRPWISAPKFKE